MEQDVLEARQAGTKGRVDTGVEYEEDWTLALTAVGFTALVLMAVHVEIWAPYITEAWVYFF
jgi:hypothetical protein